MKRQLPQQYHFSAERYYYALHAVNDFWLGIGTIPDFDLWVEPGTRTTGRVRAQRRIA